VCTQGTYAAVASTSCTTCPDGSHSEANSIECKCNAGATLSDGAACAHCSGMCPSNSLQLLKIICRARSVPKQLKYAILISRAISGGTYKNARGSAECLSCPVGTYAMTAATACSLCPPNSNSEASSNSVLKCRCNSGFTGPDSSGCTSCSREFS